MDANELKTAISNLETSLEGKSAEYAKNAVTEMKSAIETEIKSLIEKAGEQNAEALKELKGLAEAQQSHLDKLDVKMQANKGGK